MGYPSWYRTNSKQLRWMPHQWRHLSKTINLARTIKRIGCTLTYHDIPWSVGLHDWVSSGCSVVQCLCYEPCLSVRAACLRSDTAQLVHDWGCAPVSFYTICLCIERHMEILGRTRRNVRTLLCVPSSHGMSFDIWGCASNMVPWERGEYFPNLLVQCVACQATA